MSNNRHTEEMGLAALPVTLTGPWSASLGSAALHPPSTAPALGPVAGQGSWYRTGLHMLPGELNAAVLEALAAEAAGIEHKASRYIIPADFPLNFHLFHVTSLSSHPCFDSTCSTVK